VVTPAAGEAVEAGEVDEDSGACADALGDGDDAHAAETSRASAAAPPRLGNSARAGCARRREGIMA
jgi:hypothetical protein